MDDRENLSAAALQCLSWGLGSGLRWCFVMQLPPFANLVFKTIGLTFLASEKFPIVLHNVLHVGVSEEVKV